MPDVRSLPIRQRVQLNAMSEHLATEKPETRSPPPHPDKIEPRPARRFRGRTILISVSLVAVTLILTVGAWLNSLDSKSTLPPISIKEVVDANSVPVESDNFTDTMQSDPMQSSHTAVAQQPPQPEYVTDPALEETLREIQYEFKQNRDALAYFDDRIESLTALKPMIESALAVQSESADDLPLRITAIELGLQRIGELLESEVRPATKTINMSPPFRLIAVDRWENQWNAVIELDGHITVVQAQEKRAGWKLIEIDPANESASFVSASGQRATLGIN